MIYSQAPEGAKDSTLLVFPIILWNCALPGGKAFFLIALLDVLTLFSQVAILLATLVFFPSLKCQTALFFFNRPVSLCRQRFVLFRCGDVRR